MDMWMDVDVALAAVPVNMLPLLDDTDFKTRKSTVPYDAPGMDLVWNFTTCAGAYTQTAVTPTSGGTYSWLHKGDAMYSIAIPASGGASINNNTEGFGWFSGLATDVLPWRGPIIGFRAAGLNDLLIESAFSATRGLTGTAVPAIAAEAAGGLYTRGTGAGQINQTANGLAEASLTAAGLATDAVTELVAGIFAKAFTSAYGSFTFEQMIGIIASVVAAKLSGAATTTIIVRKLGDTGDVGVFTVDANGNRTAVTLTP